MTTPFTGVPPGAAQAGPTATEPEPGAPSNAENDPGATVNDRSLQPGGEGHSDEFFSIGELAMAFGVTTRAIRFYEAKMLIAPQRKGTARLYSRRDRARLQMILRGKNLGFSLEEIREFLDLYDADPTQTVQTRHLLGKIEVAMTELEHKRADIERTLNELAQIKGECLEHLEGET